MKKLIISIVATASLALVAKADGALPNATSFETYPDNVAFDVGLNDNGGEGGYIFWSGGDEGSEFLIKALAGEGGLGAKSVTRPKYWDGEDDANALSIDTDVALSRHVNAGRTAQDIGTGLYFDSMVQFTATDTAPTVEANTSDKLVVWLKEIEGSGEQPSTYKLCVTAGVWDSLGHITVTEFENTNSEIAVSPDEWYRLSISVSADEDGYPLFEVRVNGKLFTAGDVNKFMSLAYDAEDAKTITSVSFQGKGAIDDLVWTTEDPYYEAPSTTDVTISLTCAEGLTLGGENGNVFWYYNNGSNEVEYNGNVLTAKKLQIGEKVVFTCETPVGYTVEGLNKVSFNEEIIEWTSEEIEVTANLELSFTITKDDVPAANFTVGDKTFETFAEAIAEVAENGGTIVIAEDAADESLVLAKTVEIAADTTINFNGKTLTSTADPAIVVLDGALNLTGNGGITAPGVVIWQGEKNATPVTETTVNVGEGVTILSKNGDDGDNAVLMYGDATLNVAGTLETYSKGFAALQNSGNDKKANVKITITGTVINHNEAAIGMNTDKTAEATLTVKDGAVVTGATAIYAKSGTVVIEGGTITGTGAAVEFAPGQVGGKVTGDALVVEANNNYKAVSVTVTDGTFVSNNAKAIASYATPDATALVGFVTGGMFNTEIDAALLGKSENDKELELVEAETAGFWTVAEKKADETPKFGDEAYDPEDVDQNGEWTAVNSSSVITVPTGWELDDEKNTITKGAVVIKIPGYYSITPAQGGGYSLALNETARPTVAAEGATKPMEFVTVGNEEFVKLNVPNIKPRLYYSVVYADDVKFTLNMVKTDPVQGAVPTAPKGKGTNGRFFKVVVTDVPQN